MTMFLGAEYREAAEADILCPSFVESESVCLSYAEALNVCPLMND